MKVSSRVPQSKVWLLAAAWALSVLSSVFGVALLAAAPARADCPAGVCFAFDYNPDPTKVTAMLKAERDKSLDQSAFQDSEIYARGGVFGAGSEFTFQRVVDGSGITSGDNQYSFDYTCANGTPQLGTPPTNVDSYTIEASVFTYIGDFNTQQTIRLDRAYITHVTFSGAQIPNQEVKSYPDAHSVSGIPENDGNLKAMHFPSSCVAPPFVFGDKHSVAGGESMPNLEVDQAANRDWQAAITAAQNAGPGGTGPAGGGGSPSALDQCAAHSNTLGWLLCPAIDMVNNFFVSPFQNLVTNNLKVSPLDTTGGGSAHNQALYGTWNNIRNLADALFVLVFLAIIFANTLQFSVEAYAIKKVLPKLVAAAILVQFSFIISALAIDIGNILGDGINGLVQGVAHGAGGSTNDLLIAAGSVIALGVAAGAAATVGIVAVLSLAITGFFAFLAIFFTLIVRKLIIDVLIVLAPLALVAFVLPGTERFFKIWYQNLIKVILMYPLIVLLFAFSGVLSAASSGTGFQQIIASAFPIIACFMVPMTFRMAGGLMSASGNFVNGRINKVGGKTREGFKGSNFAKGLDNRQTSLREAGLQRLDNGRIGSWKNDPNSRLKRLAGRAGFHAGALAIGAGTASDLGRQRATSGLVNQYDKELQDLTQATVPNLQKALTAKFGKTKPERDQAARELRAAGGGALLSYAGTHEGRQAMMRRLADNDLTGAKLTRLMNDPASGATDRDREALKWENGKNLSTSPALFGDFNPADATASGHSKIRGLTAKDLREKVTVSNFDAAVDHATGTTVDTQMDEFTQSFAGNMSETELVKSFDTTGPGSLGADKRLAILRMMAHSGHFNSGAGYGLRKAVVDSIKNSPANSKGNNDVTTKLSAAEKAALGL